MNMSNSDLEGINAKWPGNKDLAFVEATIIAEHAQQYIEQINQRIHGVKSDELRHEGFINGRKLTRLQIISLDLAAAEFRQQGFEATVSEVECDGDTIYALGIVSKNEVS
jgi:hypothetical protein